MSSLPGLHHVTAICADPQTNLDFFTDVLGQRLVKRTVNFDDPRTYHLYYGDRAGSPGTIMTYFPLVDAGPGRVGDGMARAIAYAATPDHFDATMDRLALDAVDFDGPVERFAQRVLTLRDPDGLRVEIAETEDGAAEGFHSVTLQLADLEPTARLLIDVMGFEAGTTEITAEGERLRLRARGDGRASVVDLLRLSHPSAGWQGAGTIHHVAFRVRDDAEQREWQANLRAAGLDVTPVIDRQYFNAIYFREPGGVLFEIATDPPGFTVDEPLDRLGETLKLPPAYEGQRAQIQRVLPPLKIRP